MMINSVSLAPHFNSRPRMRANSRRNHSISRGGYFNSRPRMRANGLRRLESKLRGVFQLPPSHEGELADSIKIRITGISTPALA